MSTELPVGLPGTRSGPVTRAGSAIDVAAMPSVGQRAYGLGPGPRLLVALGSYDRGAHLLAYAIARCSTEGGTARVVHVVTVDGAGRPVPTELREEAERTVEKATAHLREHGLAASGCVKTSGAATAGLAISEEAVRWGASSVVLSAPRRPQPASGGTWEDGVREQVLRCSWRPSVLVAVPGPCPRPSVGVPAHEPGPGPG